MKYTVTRPTKDQKGRGGKENYIIKISTLEMTS